MAKPQQPPHSPTDGSYYDLGSYTRPVTTTSQEAQTWFDRGLRWAFAFNHEASAECFEAAIAHDPSLAMAHWGAAYSLGPNYNKPWAFFAEDELQQAVEKTRKHTLLAIQKAENATAAEKAIIGAVQSRYQADKPPSDCSIWNDDFAGAMREAYAAHGDDLDVAFLFADALMNLTPWALWDLRTGEVPKGAHTLEAKTVLEKALTQPGGKAHPGLLHLYIHLMEMSQHPEEALPTANLLRGLMPDAGHLNHMATHLDILTGDYLKAVEWNTIALQGDDKYLTHAGTLNFYSLYRSHNYHFKIYAAMFAGQFTTAISTVTAMEATMPDELIRMKTPPMADWLESALSFRHHVLIRFGKWQEIIDLPLPTDQILYCYTTTIAHYAKSLAHAALGNIPSAEQSQHAFQTALQTVPETRTLFNNKCTDIAQIASKMLDGEIEYRRQNFDAAFRHLRDAIDLDDNLPFDEPWGWMQPTRHAYGALLLEQGRVDEAKAVYRADLGDDETLPRALRHPKNVWALCGLVECLERLGEREEAEVVKGRLEMVRTGADVSIESSCYCRSGAK